MAFARDLRKNLIHKETGSFTRNNLILVLDDLYDTFNVGGMYRVGDAAGVSKIIHAGKTPVPPDPKILRASVGLCNYIPWEQKEDIRSTVTELREEGYKIIVLEQDKRAKRFDEVDYRQYNKGIVLIVGNETFGVKKEIVELADMVVELPMYGMNKSLNVVVATGIVLYQIGKSK